MKARCIELRAANGSLLFSLHLLDQEVGSNSRPPNAGGQTSGNSAQTGPSGVSQNDGTLMTEAQKRYLFRILADRGFEGDLAHEHLKSLFSVPALQEVTKQEASRLIERLLEEAGKK